MSLHRWLRGDMIQTRGTFRIKTWRNPESGSFSVPAGSGSMEPEELVWFYSWYPETALPTRQHGRCMTLQKEADWEIFLFNEVTTT